MLSSRKYWISVFFEKVFLSACFPGFCLSQAPGQLQLEGNYYGENLYIQNPGEGGSFCIDSVFINRNRIQADINQSAFELKLKDLGFALNSKLEITIYHKNDCKPKVLNPGPPHIGKLDFVQVNYESGILGWITKNEMSGMRLDFELEKRNKDLGWTTIARIPQKWEEMNHYFYPIPLKKGEHAFRIRAIQSNNTFIYSEIIQITL